MKPYPEVVEKIAEDYLDRLKPRLKLVPAREQAEFLREIQSHLFEAYQQTPGDDEVARILTVLRNLGDPADVVADRLPEAMERAGKKRNMILYVATGLLIALFALPVGFGGMGVVVGLLAALTGLVAAYYAMAGAVLLAGSILTLLAFTRMLLPTLWDRLAEIGFIQWNGPAGEIMDHLSASDQGLIILLFASLLLVSGWGMLRLGKHLLRSLRFLFSLTFDRMRRFSQSVRRKLRQDGRQSTASSGLSATSV